MNPCMKLVFCRLHVQNLISLSISCSQNESIVLVVVSDYFVNHVELYVVGQNPTLLSKC
jgi:hypothetical protein